MTTMFNHDLIDFEVEKVPLYQSAVSDCYYDGSRPLYGEHYSELASDVGSLLRRKDNKKPFAVVKDRYEVMQYKTTVQDIETAITNSGMDLTDARFVTNVYKGGAQLELIADFPAHETSIDGVGVVKPEFKFRTSQDGTWANNGMMGLWRSSCFNSLVSGNKLAYVYGRHTKGFNLPAFTAKIKNAGEYIRGDAIKEMKEWFNTPLHRDDAVKLFKATLAKRMDNVTRKNKHNKVILSHLMNIFDQENRHCHGKALYEGKNKQDVGSLWTAYQAATHWSTHTTRGQAKARSENLQNVRVMREERVRKMLRSKEWAKPLAIDYYKETGEV